MPYVLCKLCSKQFYTKPSYIKLGISKFCSRECKQKSQLKGQYFNCEKCRKQIWRSPKAIKHSKSNKYFCSRHCQSLWRNSHYSGNLHHNWKGDEYIYLKLMRKLHASPECKNCGIDNKKVLIVHHVDKNRKNNSIENLMWLCRNCHYLIHNGKTV